MASNFDGRNIQAAADKAFRDMTLIMDGAFKKALTDPVYPWPKGESPRDVVDTGRLRDSQIYQFSQGTAVYSWPLEYGAAVHNGYITRGRTAMPARAWTDKALAKNDPATITLRLLNVNL